MKNKVSEAYIKALIELGRKHTSLSVKDVRALIKTISSFFREHLISAGFKERPVCAIITKFRDAGRRSPPWRPHSNKIPGRPQDGADGNRRNRWEFKSNHKFYASEIDATLVEVKYFLQALSMKGAPRVDNSEFQSAFIWLTGHKILPGEYLDPIQKIEMSLRKILKDLRLVHSGHLRPLNKGGKHVPDNTFLVFARSNQLQGNLTKNELLGLMREMLSRHKED